MFFYICFRPNVFLHGDPLPTAPTPPPPPSPPPPPTTTPYQDPYLPKTTPPPPPPPPPICPLGEYVLNSLDY